MKTSAHDFIMHTEGFVAALKQVKDGRIQPSDLNREIEYYEEMIRRAKHSL